VAPGRKFKVNDHSVRIPLAVVKLMRQPALRLSAGSCPPGNHLVTCLLACAVVAVHAAPWTLRRPGSAAAPWTQGLGPMARWLPHGSLAPTPPGCFPQVSAVIVNPKDYFVASNELVVIALVVCWVITAAVDFDQAWGRPARNYVAHLTSPTPT
jgi:hypothetical protein